ncbi:unnamed protein product [Haemonchus placei]|uniref:CCHC-type domain-containing protein n=1 Tax=Haemonchus placei TaxID=6290 RepID=A0A0N4WVY3_HAEPC|nr:unnamed protein product [Haemonchus placei]
MRSASCTPQQKAWFLIGYLDGAAREKVEELPLEDRESYEAIVAHLRKSFEGPQHRYMARQALSACKQQTGESSAAFANRLLTLVRAATTEQDPATQKEECLGGGCLTPSSRYQRQRNGGYSRDAQGGPTQPCYNCGGTGHFARQSPSPRNQRRPTGTPSYNVRSRPLDRHLPHSSPSSELYPARRDQSHDLLEAREQIRALSVSLRENQSALERFEARAHALIKRNEELAQSSFGGLPSSSSRSGSTHLPQVKFLLPLVALHVLREHYSSPNVRVALLAGFIGHVYENSIHLHTIARILVLASVIFLVLSLYVYRPNTERYDTSAFLWFFKRSSSALPRVVDKKVRFEDNTPDTDDIVEFPRSKTVPFRSTPRLVGPEKLKDFWRFIQVPQLAAILIGAKRWPRYHVSISGLRWRRTSLLWFAHVNNAKGEDLSEVGRLLRISCYFTTPYHHEGNGACERVFATFHPMLRTYIAENQRDWDSYVKACAFMYNTSVHTSTNNTPYFLMFGRDPVFNIDLLIKHDLERHTPSLDDAGLYVENLVATLHAAWRSAKDFNDRQRAKYKQQHDRTHLRPLDIRVGDRVFLRDLAPKVGLSSKLCNPWLGQFRVVEVDPPHLTIVSVSAPQSSPRRAHINQVKRCYELSGPVFTSQWTPVEEQAALSAAGATELTMPGYSHQITAHFSMTAMDSAPPHPVASDQSDQSALDSNDAIDSSSFALQELDLLEDALLAPRQSQRRR